MSQTAEATRRTLLPFESSKTAAEPEASSTGDTRHGNKDSSSNSTSNSSHSSNGGSHSQQPPSDKAADPVTDPQVPEPEPRKSRTAGVPEPGEVINGQAGPADGEKLRPSAPAKHETSRSKFWRSSSRPRDEQEGAQVSTLATKIYTIGYLCIFSIFGVLARLGLQALTVYPNAPVQQGTVWANLTGSFVMGFLAEDRQLFRQEWGEPSPTDSTQMDSTAEKKRHGAVKKTIPFFIGLATGFCGSCTSFSSFQRDTFLILANSAPSPEMTNDAARNGGYSFMAVIASLIVTPVLSLAALQGGAHLAIALDGVMPNLNIRVMRRLCDPLASFIGFGMWLGAVFLAIWPPDRPSGPAAHRGSTWANETWRGQAVFACVFAPLGTLVRFYVSMWLNPKIATFPLGTFAVNIGGTLFEGLFYDLQHAGLPAAHYLVGGGRVGCQVLQGLQDGFCGCLTTISTWVAELKGLRRSNSYVYGLVSLAVGVGMMVIVMGSLRWTHGFSAPSCVT